jgi:hypothetical protein
MRIYFGPGFRMTCAGQDIATDADGFAEVASPTPEIMAWALPEPPGPVEEPEHAITTHEGDEQ